ncbi:uncharacterized protein IWZ02DRAFT_509945 [Phyllosticta citriasiana]|uniref:uncharacterized protein n=1 Tax=Phyllosticta citriasiana TaxID=595635 RepID=UPI0030FDDCD8
MKRRTYRCNFLVVDEDADFDLVIVLCTIQDEGLALRDMFDDFYALDGMNQGGFILRHHAVGSTFAAIAASPISCDDVPSLGEFREEARRIQKERRDRYKQIQNDAGHALGTHSNDCAQCGVAKCAHYGQTVSLCVRSADLCVCLEATSAYTKNRERAFIYTLLGFWYLDWLSNLAREWLDENLGHLDCSCCDVQPLWFHGRLRSSGNTYLGAGAVRYCNASFFLRRKFPRYSYASKRRLLIDNCGRKRTLFECV